MDVDACVDYMQCACTLKDQYVLLIISFVCASYVVAKRVHNNNQKCALLHFSPLSVNTTVHKKCMCVMCMVYSLLL